MAKDGVLLPYDESLARRVAGILGDSSAASEALVELERRRAEGEDVYLWWAAAHVVVGPIPALAAVGKE